MRFDRREVVTAIQMVRLPQLCCYITDEDLESFASLNCTFNLRYKQVGKHTCEKAPRSNHDHIRIKNRLQRERVGTGVTRLNLYSTDATCTLCDAAFPFNTYSLSRCSHLLIGYKDNILRC